MQKPKKTTPESKAQSDGCLRLKLKSRIIELQLLQGIPKVRIFGTIRRIQTAVHHGLHLFVSRQGSLTGIRPVRHRISDSGIFHILDASSDVSYHTGTQLPAGNKLPGTKITNLHHVRFRPGGHHTDRCSLAHGSFLNPAKNNDPFIRIIHRIKNQSLKRCSRTSLRCRYPLDNLL